MHQLLLKPKYGTSMLTEKQKDTHIKKTTGAELYLPMKSATSYLETSFIDGQKTRKLKLKEFQTIDRLWCGAVSVSKVLSTIIHSQIL